MTASRGRRQHGPFPVSIGIHTAPYETKGSSRPMLNTQPSEDGATTARVDRRRFWATMAWATALLALPKIALARTCRGVSYEDMRQVSNKMLRLNGVGVRQATIFHIDVYVAALYVERPSRNARELLKVDQLEQLALTLVRDISAEQMNEAIRSGFGKNVGGDYADLRARVDELQRSIPALKAGHVFTITFMPGQGVSVFVNGGLLKAIPGDDFARALLSIWLGASPPNEGLKSGLLGEPC